jgi:hypothetical protein
MGIDDFVRTLNLMLLREKSSEDLTEVELDRERLADVVARTAVFMGEAGDSAAKDKLMSYYSALRDSARELPIPYSRLQPE